MRASTLPLKVCNICQGYTAEHVVLNNVSFCIGNNEYVGLLGLNGAGKTSLFKAILNLLPLSAGEVYIYGDGHDQFSARARLTFIPEFFRPAYYLTGFDFLRYMSELDQCSYSLSEISELCQMLDFSFATLKKATRSYSKGMLQKLGWIYCLLSKKPLFLLDEPMQGLDLPVQCALRAYLRGLKNSGQTLLFTTHCFADIQQMCDRIIVLHRGRIHFDGTLADFCTKYDREQVEAAYLACITET